MPVHSYPPCPTCGEKLVRKRAGRCSSCGAQVAAFVEAERQREEKIEKVVAIISTFLVVTVLVLGGGFGVIEGVLMYALAGAAVWYHAKRTYWSQTLREAPEGVPGDDERPEEAS